MLQLKAWTALLVLWLCVFFTIERLHEPLNIASFIYVMTAVTSVALLLQPRFSQWNRWSVFLVLLGLMLILKKALGYPTWGTALPITITEGLALGLTIYLAGRVNESVREFQQAALKVATAGQLGRATEFDSGQSEIYRELRRARTYGRPLALLTIAPQLDGNERLLDSMVEEIYRKSARQYLHSQIAELLSIATDGCATVVSRDDHLVISLPEVDSDRAAEMLIRIRDVVRQQLGIELDTGMAAFPDQELTLRGLLDHAEASMRWQRDDSRPIDEDLSSPVLSGPAEG